MRKTKLKINNKCRTCPRTDNFLGISVNGFSETHEEPIYLMLVYCTQMQFSPNDALPQRVCPDCLALLDASYGFWKQCRQREAQLRRAISGGTRTSVSVELMEPEDEPVPEAPPVPEVAPAPTETASPTPQSFWCCFRKCPTVTTSLADMEKHAEQDHFAARVANEVQRAPNREHVCSVCCAGYASLGNLEYHRMIQLGIRPKFGVSAGDTTEKQQDEEEEQPKDDRVDVKKEAEKQESAMDFEVSDAADENATNSTMPFEIVPIKEESYISDEQDESVQDALKSEAEKFDCPHCGVEILSDEEKQRHLVCECPVLHRRDVQGSSKQCPRCRRNFNTSEGLDRHVSLCTADKPDAKLTCPNCGSVFNAKANLCRHLKIGTCLRDPYQCKYCFEKLPDMKGLNRHCKVECRAMLNAESNGIKMKCHCEHCGKGFRTKGLLRRHQIVDGCGAEDRMAKTVKDPKKIQCPYCFEHFILKNLKRHLQQHCLVLLEKQVEAKRAAAALAQDATSGTR